MKIVGNNITIDGEKTLLISGAMHYFRTLPEQWEDRLEKIAAAGFNCVETYVPWNLHEPQEGVYNFSGMLDIGRLLKLPDEKGLYNFKTISIYLCRVGICRTSSLVIKFYKYKIENNGSNLY